MKQPETESFWGGMIKSMGLVFGDVGTSPIYTLTVIFALTKPTYDNVLGILSLVVWTLTILVTVEYAWLATSLSRKGQGGEIVLREILLSCLKSGRAIAFAGFLTFIGVSLLLGDGVITPAITILSAVEGMLLIPGMENMNQTALIAIAAAITITLFVVQSRGSDRIAAAFGPIMLIWFSTLALSGLASILTMPDIIKVVNPWYAVKFFQHHGFAAFFVLSEVILCATGGEALYADMGHLGRKPILRAWYFVFVALIINYMGQGVFAIEHPEAKHYLFGMVQNQASFLYIPFLLLTVMATIIASQSIISGVFSIVYQGITTRLMPLMKIDYTSRKLQSQIYIGAVNWALMISVIFIMIIFQKSSNLAAAYGMAVTGSMTITSLMMIMVFSHTTRWKVPIAVAVCLIDFIYLASTFTKLPNGAYWSLIIASVPFIIMLIFTKGQKMLFRRLMPLDMETFLISYEQVYGKGRNIAGTALFFTRQGMVVPPYIVHCILGSSIIYENNVFVSITRTEEPFGVETRFQQNFAPGLHLLDIMAGYMTVVDIEKLLKEKDVKEKIIFYGVEDIATKNPLWQVFSVIKKLSPNFVQFHKLPSRKLHGVVTRVEM
ncbi:MAG: KUP/HAK/KT family potassium transporter [Syntrophus sp. (in: bacteria)]